jgi:hypothetical protein
MTDAKISTPRRTRLPAPLLACAFVFMLIVPALAGSDAFVAGVEDLPLMPGLAEVRDAGIVFDTPGGRIVETYAKGAARRAEVIAFYRQTLPQLGWQSVGDTVYRREGERLQIVIFGGNGGNDGGGDGDLVVRFTLQPE